MVAVQPPSTPWLQRLLPSVLPEPDPALSNNVTVAQKPDLAHADLVDVNVAQRRPQFTSLQILETSGISVLSQAQQLPQLPSSSSDGEAERDSEPSRSRPVCPGGSLTEEPEERP